MIRKKISSWRQFIHLIFGCAPSFHRKDWVEFRDDESCELESRYKCPIDGRRWVQIVIVDMAAGGCGGGTYIYWEEMGV